MYVMFAEKQNYFILKYHRKISASTEMSFDLKRTLVDLKQKRCSREHESDDSTFENSKPDI